jgi:hypothetical protein
MPAAVATVPAKGNHMSSIHEPASAGNDFRKLICHGDWAQIARDAWAAPSWREAAIDYHRTRLAAPHSSADSLIPSRHDIWRVAGRCIKRRRPADALRTFLKWCDHACIERSVGLPVFKTIIEKELQNERF